RLAHFKYLFYNRTIEDIRKVQNELEDGYIAQVGAVDSTAVELLGRDAAALTGYLTDYASRCAANTCSRWKQLGNFLLVKYMDGLVKQEEDGVFKDNGYGYPARPKSVGYPESWYRHVVGDTGEKFLVPNQD
ncbi:MAG: dipeptidase, partial [Bacteroidales bacterium]|nr:dipeptidase [Bacteroidales bacterium]